MHDTRSGDRSLVRQTLAGETEAFGRLVGRYSGLVYGSILGIVRRPEVAEDLAQEAFCQAYESLSDLRRPSRFAAWLGQIARHTAQNWLRREQIRVRVEGDPSLLDSWQRPELPDAAVENGERSDLVWKALDHLAPTARSIVVLYHMEGCRYAQIARFLGIPLTTVRWKLLRAQQQLGKYLSASLARERATRKERREALDKRILASLSLTGVLYERTEAAAVGWLGAALAGVPLAMPGLVLLGAVSVFLALHYGPALVGGYGDVDERGEGGEGGPIGVSLESEVAPVQAYRSRVQAWPGTTAMDLAVERAAAAPDWEDTSLVAQEATRQAVAELHVPGPGSGLGYETAAVDKERAAWDDVTEEGAGVADLAPVWAGRYRGEGDLYIWGTWSRNRPSDLHLTRTRVSGTLLTIGAPGTVRLHISATTDSLQTYGLSISEPIALTDADRLVGEASNRGLLIRYDLRRRSDTIEGSVTATRRSDPPGGHPHMIFRFRGLIRSIESSPRGGE